MAEVFSVELVGPAVLFSGLFYVAASRLNSPRLSVCLYAAMNLAVKQHRTSTRQRRPLTLYGPTLWASDLGSASAGEAISDIDAAAKVWFSAHAYFG